MSLSPGTRLGPYEVTAQIGVGGMGEVYRAHDTKLGRDVALKVLPAALASDPDRIVRFEREAKTLAALNHPHIAALYGLEETPSLEPGEPPLRALVMELVEGPTLADRIAYGGQGPRLKAQSPTSSNDGSALPLGEALTIAAQIAEALEAAHELGIIHRDLKPANIKVREDGTVKVLDFGLAKALEPGTPGSGTGAGVVSQLPTITTPAHLREGYGGQAMTQVGTILGTAAYMSPEQAKGRPADKRSDVWAFGCVLYEMLTGRRAFHGEDVTETLAFLITRDPDWTALPANTPVAVRALLRRCLEKKHRDRVADISTVRFVLAEQANLVAPSVAPADQGRRAGSRTREYAWAALAAALLVTTLGLLLWPRHAPSSEARSVVRFEMRPPPDATTVGDVTLSPDGRMVAAVATTNNARSIWLRPLDALEWQPLAGSEDGNNPFWSPDSGSVAFSAGGRLKVVPVSGGSARVLATLPDGESYVGTWGTGGHILLGARNIFTATGNLFAREGQSTRGIGRVTSAGLLRVSANGGEPAPASQPHTALKEQFHTSPYFLPDGQHYIFLAGGADGFASYVGTLGSTERTPLPRIESTAVYSPSGHVLFIRDGVLMAQAFDAERSELTGQAAPLVDEFVLTVARTGPFAAGSGALAFRRAVRRETSLTWFDRSGRQLGVVGTAGVHANAELSKDDRYVAWDEGPRPGSDTWIADIERGATTPFTSDPVIDGIAQWSPDGRSIIRRVDREGAIGSLYSATSAWLARTPCS